MEQYKGICKFRMCGEEFEVATSISSKEFAQYFWDQVATTPYVRHICKDGSWGLGDFQGFKKINED